LLSAYDIPSRNLNSDFEFVPGRITSLVFLESGDAFALNKDGSLYSFNLNQSSRVRLAQGVRSMTLGRAADKLVALASDGMRVFFLRDRRLDTHIRLPDAARIQKLIWYRDGEHLFVQYPDKVMFLELADAALLNFQTVTAGARAEYEPNSNTLYFLENSVLRELDFPSS
jgi:hypothetical protein